MQMRYCPTKRAGCFHTDHVRPVLILDCVASTGRARVGIAAFFACPLPGKHVFETISASYRSRFAGVSACGRVLETGRQWQLFAPL